MDVRLRVDWIRCDGYGLCGDLAPDLIALDEWRYPILRAGAVDASLVNDARRAVDCCPMKALFLEPLPAERRHGFGTRPQPAPAIRR